MSYPGSKFVACLGAAAGLWLGDLAGWPLPGAILGYTVTLFGAILYVTYTKEKN
jgi:putative effector of murein hydrolase LrgA (UPF0299 family)